MRVYLEVSHWGQEEGKEDMGVMEMTYSWDQKGWGRRRGPLPPAQEQERFRARLRPHPQLNQQVPLLRKRNIYKNNTTRRGYTISELRTTNRDQVGRIEGQRPRTLTASASRHAET